MNVVKIDGRVYDVLVTELSENFNVLYSENTGRTIEGGMVLDPIGTFIGHKITFKRKNGCEKEFDRLFNYLSKPRYDGLQVEVVHGQSSIEYEAYVSNGERSLRKIDPNTGLVYWDKLSINIIPMKAQEVP